MSSPSSAAESDTTEADQPALTPNEVPPPPIHEHPRVPAGYTSDGWYQPIPVSSVNGQHNGSLVREGPCVTMTEYRQAVARFEQKQIEREGERELERERLGLPSQAADESQSSSDSGEMSTAFAVEEGP